MKLEKDNSKNNINNNIISNFKRFGQEKTIQKWTFIT